jgi:hypothetical protein
MPCWLQILINVIKLGEDYTLSELLKKFKSTHAHLPVDDPGRLKALDLFENVSHRHRTARCSRIPSAGVPRTTTRL